jgi:hypothetical protein
MMPVPESGSEHCTNTINSFDGSMKGEAEVFFKSGMFLVKSLIGVKYL